MEFFSVLVALGEALKNHKWSFLSGRGFLASKAFIRAFYWAFLYICIVGRKKKLLLVKHGVHFPVAFRERTKIVRLHPVV